MPPRGEVDYTRQDLVELHLNNVADDDCYCMDPEYLAKLRSLPGNDQCIDCGKADPVWASMNLGVFMCLECSGQHRALGTHVSFVRSVKMDSWSDVQLQKMRIGGNQQCLEYLKGHGISIERECSSTTIRERYDCAPGLLYQQVLLARREGRPEPTELPDYTPYKDPQPTMKAMKGFGSQEPSLVTHQKQQGQPIIALEIAMSMIWNNLTEESIVDVLSSLPCETPETSGGGFFSELSKSFSTSQGDTNESGIFAKLSKSASSLQAGNEMTSIFTKLQSSLTSLISGDSENQKKSGLDETHPHESITQFHSFVWNVDR